MFDLATVFANAKRLCRYADAVAAGDDSAKADAYTAFHRITAGMERQCWPDAALSADWSALPAAAEALRKAALGGFISDDTFHQVGALTAIGIAYGQVCLALGHASEPLVRLSTISSEDEPARLYVEEYQEAAE